jgi:arylsulfatase
MYVQHFRLKDKWSDWDPASSMPYEDVANIRPETKKMVETWLKTYGDVRNVILGVESAGN